MKRLHKLSSPTQTTARLVLLVLIVKAGIAMALADSVFPPISHPYGKSYPEWVVKWWRWSDSLTQDPNVIGDGSLNQSGHVWFLGGLTFDHISNRSAVIPSGTALFLALETADEFNIWEDPSTHDNGFPEVPASELLVDVHSIFDGASRISLKIDGRPVHDMDDFRFTAPLFSDYYLDVGPYAEYFGSLGAPYFPPQPVSPVAAEGYFVMIPPLSVGRHSIFYTIDVPALGVVNDVTYTIIVKPGHRE